ncbi:hypothetical protein HID58_067264 [Brassica napus]|uniref:F-box domain-containing protein n=1 Tax=Brassica napus TaxID=3708 RepID=A0ABQ7ZI12_BRANA|nr:hypothetical protein HID58_067264 [Brassica napus]
MKDLPPDLVVEILSRVPASSLKRLRSKKHFHKAPRKSHVIMLKEFMFCPMKIDVVPPSTRGLESVGMGNKVDSIQ